ncbi:Microtubule-associated protein futsch [Papilio machaon]|uniref:Microtubule-associated protein futsch n=1 Tax=Papilio machaon TaxID=76193 RepID=A0A194RR39_PAPMA|nr:Microtubule-associated protein futsch [Papilio machaon]
MANFEITQVFFLWHSPATPLSLPTSTYTSRSWIVVLDYSGRSRNNNICWVHELAEWTGAIPRPQRRQASSGSYSAFRLMRLLSWDSGEHQVDLEKELATLAEQAPEGEEARYGERLIQYASENLVTEILIHPQMNTLMQCMRNLLSSFTRHRHLVHAGYTFAGNGSWIMQDGTFSLADFTDAYQENEVQRVIRAYENSISITIHCAAAGEWAKLPQMPFVKHCKINVNPTDILDSGSKAIKDFTTYLEPYIVPASLEQLLVSSDVVGNIRFSHPTLYVFPGGQGDAALFGINGFNMLVDGGFSRKACWWDFARHLDRLDAVLLTRLNNCSAAGMAAVLRRKATANVYPQIGHFFCNLEERRAVTSPDGDKDTDPLLVSLLQEGSDMMADLRHINLKPQHCYRSPDPINLYHKVGHGTLDMYVLNPSKDSKHVREFLKRWHSSEQKLFEGASVSGQFNFPIPNLVSICALLVWRPANPDDTITRIMFPGSTPQHKIFEGLEKLKHLEILQHPTCTGRQMTTAAVPAPAPVVAPVAPTAVSVIKTKQVKSKERSIITETKTKEEKIHETEQTKIRTIKDVDSKNLIDNKLLNELVDGEDKKIESVLQEAIATRMDSKLDDKFAQYESTVVDGLPKKRDTKKKEKPIDKKAKRTDDNKESLAKTADLKKVETETKIKPDGKKKSELKAKPEMPSTISKSKISHRTTQKKVTSAISDKRTALDDKKSPPTTPKKSIESKSITNIISKDKVKGKTRRQSPITTPAKSVKEASNRRVVESKYKQSSPKRDIPQKTSDKKEMKPKREPISRRPRPLGSPIKGLKSMKSPTKAVKTTKSDTAKLKGLQRVNYEDILKDAKKSDEDTSKSLDDIKQQELDEREEQEIVREIEAVFNRDSEAEEKIEYVGRSDIEKITCLIDDTKTDVPPDTEFEEEYLIIEKEEVDQYTEDSILEQELSPVKDTDLMKHLKDKEESEKKKEDLTSQVKIPSKIDTEKMTKEEVKHDSKEHSESLEEKQDISSEKKTTDSKSGLLKAKDSLDLNIVQESQPDEKISTTVESGATTAPTLPEDERITLDEIKEDQHVEEKYIREETKEMHVPQPFIDSKPPVSERIPIKEPQPVPLRDVVKTPDEVADLPLHEEVDYRTFDEKKTPIEENVFKQKIDLDLQKDLKVPKDLPIKDALSRTIQDDVVIKTIERPSHPEIVTVTPGSAPESPMYHDQTKVSMIPGKDLEPVKEYDDNEYIYGQYTEQLRETHITTLDSPIKDEVRTIDDTQPVSEKIPSIPEDVEKEIEEEHKLETLEKPPLSPKDVERIVADVAQVLKSDKSLDELIAEKSPIFRKSPEGIKKLDDTQYKEISPMRSLTSEDVSDISDKTVLSDEKKVKHDPKLDTEVSSSTLMESEVKKPHLKEQKLENGETEKHLSDIIDEKQEKRLSITLDSAKTLEKLEEKLADLKKKEDNIQKELQSKEGEKVEKPVPSAKVEKLVPSADGEKPSFDTLEKEKTPSPVDKMDMVEKPIPSAVDEVTTVDKLVKDITPSPLDKEEKVEKPITSFVDEKQTVDTLEKEKTPSPVDKIDKVEKPVPSAIDEKLTVVTLEKEKMPSSVDKMDKFELPAVTAVDEKLTIDKLEKDKMASPLDKEEKVEKPVPTSVDDKETIDKLDKEKTPSPVDRMDKVELPVPSSVDEKLTFDTLKKEKTASYVTVMDKVETPVPASVDKKLTFDELVKDKTSSPLDEEEMVEKPFLAILKKEDTKVMDEKRLPGAVDVKTTIDKDVKDITPSHFDQVDKTEKPIHTALDEKVSIGKLEKDKTPSSVDVSKQNLTFAPKDENITEPTEKSHQIVETKESLLPFKEQTEKIMEDKKTLPFNAAEKVEKTVDNALMPAYVNGHFQSPKLGSKEETEDIFILESLDSLSPELETSSTKDEISPENLIIKSKFAKQIKESEEMITKERSFYTDYDIGIQSIKQRDDKLSSLSTIDSGIIDKDSFTHTLKHGVSSEDISKEVSIEEKHSFESSEKSDKKQLLDRSMKTSGYKVITSEFSSYSDSYQSTSSQHTSFVDSTQEEPLSDVNIAISQIDREQLNIDSKEHGIDTFEHVKDKSINEIAKQPADSQLVKTIQAAFEDEGIQQGIRTEEIEYISSKVDRVSTPPTVPVSPLPKIPLQDLKLADGVQSEVKYDKLQGAEETITKIVHVGEDVLTQKISTSTEKVPKPLKSDKEDEDTLSLMQTMGKIKTETDTVTKIIKDGENVVTQTITTVTTKEIISREDGTPQNVKTTIETTTLSKSSDGSITTTTDTQTLLSECSSSLRSTSQMDLYDKEKKLDKLYIEHGDEKSESEYSYQTQESYSKKGWSEKDKSHFIKEDEETDSSIEAVVIDTDVSKKIIKENNLDIIENITTTTKKETIRMDDNRKLIKTTVETNTTKEYPDGSKDVHKNVEVKTEEVTVDSSSNLDKLLSGYSLLEEPEENVSTKTETITCEGISIKRTITTSTIKSKYVDNESIPRKLKTVTTVTTTDEYPDGSTQSKIETSTSLSDIEMEDVEENLDLSEYTIEEDMNVDVQRQEKEVILNGKNVLQIITTTTTKKVLTTRDKAKKKIKTIVETVTESLLPDGITEVTKDVNISISDYNTQPVDDISDEFEEVGEPNEETKTEKQTITDSGETVNRTVTVITTIQNYINISKTLKRIKTTVKTITEDEYPDGSVITKTSEKVSILDENLEINGINLEENELKDSLQSTKVDEILKDLKPLGEPEETETLEREDITENDLTIKRTICTKIIKSCYANDQGIMLIQKVVKTVTTTDVFPDGSSRTSVDTTTSISEIDSNEKMQTDVPLQETKDVKIEKRTNVIIKDGVQIKQVITTTTTKELITDEDLNKKIKTTVETVTESTSPNGAVEVIKDVRVSITDYEEDTLEETLKEFIEIGKPVITQSSDLQDIKQNGITISRKTTITTTKQEYERTATRTRKVKIIVETVIEDEYPDGTVITKRSEKISIADVLPTMSTESLEDEDAPESQINDTEIVEDTNEELDIKKETFLKGSITVKRTITTKTKRETLASDDQNIKRVRTTVETTTVDEYPDGSVETTKDVKITISEYQKTTDSDLQAALRGLTPTGKIKTSVDKQSNRIQTESNESVTQNITTYTTKEEFKNNETSDIAVKTVTETVTENVHNDGTIETTKDVRTQITYLPPGTTLDDWSPEDLEKITSTQPTKVEDKPKIDDLILENKHGKNVVEKPKKQRSPVGEITTDTETFTKIIKEGDNEITQNITVVTTKEVITPEKIKITVETTTVSKGNDGIVKTTKSTKTTISEIKEEYEEIIDTGGSEKSFSKLSSKTGDMRSSSAASDDLDHPGISTPPSDISSRGSRAATHVWGTESSGMYYSDDDGQMSPSSTKSQIAHSPRSNVSFELDPKLSQLSETRQDLLEEKSEFESMKYRDPSPSVHLSHIGDTDSCTSSTHSEIKSEVQVTDRIGKTSEQKLDDEKQSFKSDITFLKEADEHFEKAIEEHKKVSGSDVISSITAKYELGEQTHSSASQLSTKEESTITLKDLKSESKKSSETSSFSATRQEAKSKTQSKTVEKDPIESWGKPLGLPSPILPPTSQGDGKNTPKKQGPSSNVQIKNKLNQEKSKDMKNRASESPSKKKSPSPVYMELTYVPHHGNSYYSAVEFFKRVRARYYVFSGTEPSKEIYNALLDAKKTWEDKDLEVTIIPTYDTDVLGYWVTENEEALEKYKIDLSPSASRCTINLQDHETSCAAYRLEF